MVITALNQKHTNYITTKSDFYLLMSNNMLLQFSSDNLLRHNCFFFFQLLQTKIMHKLQTIEHIHESKMKESSRCIESTAFHPS